MRFTRDIQDEIQFYFHTNLNWKYVIHSTVFGKRKRHQSSLMLQPGPVSTEGTVQCGAP